MWERQDDIIHSPATEGMLFTCTGRVPRPYQEPRSRVLGNLPSCEAAHVPMYVQLLSQLQSGLVTSALTAGTCPHLGHNDISSIKYLNKGFYDASELRSLTVIGIFVFNNKYQS